MARGEMRSFVDRLRKTASRLRDAVVRLFSDEHYAAARKMVAAAFERDHPEWQISHISRPGRDGSRLIFYVGYDWRDAEIVQMPAPMTVYEYDIANNRARELSPTERTRYLCGRK